MSEQSVGIPLTTPDKLISTDEKTNNPSSVIKKEPIKSSDQKRFFADFIDEEGLEGYFLNRERPSGIFN